MIKKMLTNRSTGRVFRDFADISDLVYFGGIENHDEIESVKGFTFNPDSRDTHYMHGTVYGYDVTLLKRDAVLSLPTHGAKEYSWTILQIDLHVRGLPHIFIDTHRYDEYVYSNIKAKYHKLRTANAMLAHLNATFTSMATVLTKTQNASNLSIYISDTVMQHLLASYMSYDVEILEDKVLLYLPNDPISVKQLKTMLEAALWLGEHLEYTEAELNPALVY